MAVDLGLGVIGFILVIGFAVGAIILNIFDKKKESKNDESE